ncbi:amino acid adenylation domain-containing protein [Pseudonocardia sp. H11422]|uniref:amino acid adenylation domain-containing protein n=1 Tax=Pseudonocardia sp. H11422 TaxID=2835866 RepID=UPI002029485A|nr:amino acid adenylation domain-containing protein [Pseudonocardia sp. H11422]
MISLLQDYLLRSAERTPDSGALVMGDDRLTYGELERETNRLARLMREMGCVDGARVCVLAAKTPWTIVGLIAVLKAGGVYVPIDSASPSARVARIVDVADPSLILADGSAVKLVDDLIDAGALSRRNTRIGSVNGRLSGAWFTSAFTCADAATLSAEPLGRPRVSDDIAHLLFTSGSTGVPKGVMITHANVLAFVEWAVRYFGMKPTDRISGHPPLHFDLSTFDIYGALAAGAELHLVPGTLSVNPRALADLIRDGELTQWFSVPSVLTYMAKFDVVTDHDFPALERLLWCGEVLPTPVLAYWMRRLPHVRFTNLYGPTEATIASSYYTVPICPVDETAPIPIGTPCDGEDLLILDETLRPTPVGEIGDLYISGVGLSPGYWRDAEKTAGAFLPAPNGPGSTERIYRTGDLAQRGDDGLVQFLGRADSQIKSRGYRIELGEIEAAVNATEGVRECAVVGVDTGGFEGNTICCAFSTPDGVELPALALRAEVSRLLPAYMLPARWREMDALPKNVNGKIDRKELKEWFVRELTPAQGAQQR